LETEKNKLDNLLRNNLLRKLERLQAELNEGSGEDRKQKLEMEAAELESINSRIAENNARFAGRCWRQVIKLCKNNYSWNLLRANV
jgi:predicted nuclease with TOPRIM domain